jgi:hypothetical protein
VGELFLLAFELKRRAFAVERSAQAFTAGVAPVCEVLLALLKHVSFFSCGDPAGP